MLMGEENSEKKTHLSDTLWFLNSGLLLILQLHLCVGSLDANYKQCSTLCKNSFLLSPFLQSKEQMRIGGDEGDKG